MAVKWSKEQEQAINLRGCNLLVSAAAGSGKTAVLVERILKLITDKENPVDIDRLLVVTFTRAAAAEMRERVSLELDRLLESDPKDANLLRQSSLIHNAMITTIDSFCLFVVRNHFEEINLEPNFRIAEEGEMKLLQADVLDAVFEEQYQGKDRAAFLALLDAYAGKRSSQSVKDMVEKIYRMSSASPWPRQWVEGLIQVYRSADLTFLEEICKYTKEMIAGLRQQLKGLHEIALMPDGPDKYAATLAEDLEALAVMEDIIAQMPAAEGMEAGQPTAETVGDEPMAGAAEAEAGQPTAETAEEGRVEAEAEEGQPIAGEAAAHYAAYRKFFSELKWGKLAAIRNYSGDENKKDAVQNGRKQIKKELDDLRKKYFSMDEKEVADQLKRLCPVAEELARLTLCYMDAMDREKRKKRMMDFGDIAHFALQILVDEKTGKSRPVAEEFRHHFAEIMVDEYQDSNLVQEVILRAVSGEEEGVYNMFMVGDVKQSIYRFRLARPELFMEKYQTYDIPEEASDSPTKKICLYQNYRSRREVLDFANDVFYKIMASDLGGITYDKEAELFAKAPFPETLNTQSEVLFFDGKDELVKELEEESNKEIEARMVAGKIRELMSRQMVFDKDAKVMRPLRYSDIVILFRTIKDWGTTFAEVLSDAGIPAHVESSTGYFAAVEVQTVLNMLRILDNPYQDIPMAAVLKSPMVGLGDEELAKIRLKDAKMPFAVAAFHYMRELAGECVPEEAGNVPETAAHDQGTEMPAPAEYDAESMEGRLARFYRLYQRLRSAKDMPIHQLILRILTDTGYGNYVAAMPAGKQRAANLQMLQEKAISYGKTSYKGLFHFVRYIDQLQKYDVDFGEAEVTAENADVVHIMTIHKSKGLEFPVVFVSGLTKNFNQMDARARLVIHPELGMGFDEILLQPKRKKESLFSNLVSDFIQWENLGEELRVLYVAMTRAKEKLILTGFVKDREKFVERSVGNVLKGQPLSYRQRVKATSYTDWVYSALLSYPQKYTVEFVEPEALVWEEVEEQVKKKIDYEETLSEIEAVSEEALAAVEKEFSYVYPYQKDVTKKGKYSVSELKHDSMRQKYEDQEGEAELPDFLKNERESYVPEFARRLPQFVKMADDQKDSGKDGVRETRGVEHTGQEMAGEAHTVQAQDREETHAGFGGVSQGALRGSAMHRVMECLDFAALADLLAAEDRVAQKPNVEQNPAGEKTDEEVFRQFVKKELTRMEEGGELTSEMRGLVLPSLVEEFVKSPVAARMALAAKRGDLYREKPFVMEHEDVLVQGIIDVFWLEGEDIVLLDYKTDRVENGEELALRYREQLRLYGEALERFFSGQERPRKAKEQLLYSFRLKEVIPV